MAISRATFLRHIREMYREANMADSDNPQRSKWMKPSMAGESCCQHLDAMMHAMVADGMLTEAEVQKFHDTL